MITQANVQSFIARQRLLLGREREAEVERSSLLLSNCGPKLLEQKGLSLGGLGIVSVNIGLGGKTYALLHTIIVPTLISPKRRLVELERPAAYHSSPVFPPHNLRCV
jgi:DNA polymerase alpha-associated DNA helicase A